MKKRNKGGGLWRPGNSAVMFLRIIILHLYIGSDEMDHDCQKLQSRGGRIVSDCG